MSHPGNCHPHRDTEAIPGPADPGDTSILDAEGPLLAAFPGKAKAYLTSVDSHVPVLQRGQPIAVVLVRIFVVSYTDQRCLKKMNERREHLFPG